MSGKRVAIGGKPRPAEANAWVERREGPAGEPAVPMKRLTLDIPADLHRAIKAQCAQRGTKMAEELRELLAHKYGNKDIQK